MRLKMFAAAAGLALLAVPAIAAAPEDVIAKALAGRTAGTPTDCITQYQIDSTEIVPGTAILYKMRDGTIYLNRPESGAAFLHRDYALVTDTHSDRLCRVDIVRLIDTTSRFETGSLGLGQFVPYARPPRAAR